MVVVLSTEAQRTAVRDDCAGREAQRMAVWDGCAGREAQKMAVQDSCAGRVLEDGFVDRGTQRQGERPACCMQTCSE